MKLKRLIAAVVTAALTLVSAVSTMSFGAYAADSVNYIEYTPEGQPLSDYLINHSGGATTVIMPTITLSGDNYPSLLSAQAFQTLRNLYNNSGILLDAEFVLVDRTYGATYKVVISNRVVAELPSTSSVFSSGLNLAINIGPDNTYTDSYNKNLKGVKITGTATQLGHGYGGLNLKYTILGSDWDDEILYDLGLEDQKEYNMNYYSLDADGEKTNVGYIKGNADAIFYMNNDTMSGIHFVYDPLFKYYTTKEVDDKLKEAITAVLAGVDEKFENLDAASKQYVLDTVAALKTQIEGSGYLTEDTIDSVLDTYYSDPDNLNELVDAVIERENLSKKIDDEIYRAFGYDASTKTASELEGAVKDRILDYVSNFIGTAQTPTSRISDVIKAVITDDYIKSAVNDLSDEIDDINDELAELGADITNINKTLEYLDFLKTQFGTSNVADTLAYINSMRNQFGSSSVADILRRITDLENKPETKPVDGKDGQSFTDWAIQNYQSVDNFINYIANLVATKTRDGASAYEIAVKNGFKGSEKEWLESLKGKDAYQLAVELGFVGTQKEWLDSLRGEDGEDGEIIYVNGAYNNLPDSTIDDSDDDDVSVEEDDEEDDAVSVEEDDEDDTINDDEDEELADPDSADDEEDVEIVPDNDNKPSDDDTAGDNIYIVDDKPAHKPSANNPATGVAVGIIIPLAGVGSVLLLKKDKRRRGRK